MHLAELITLLDIATKCICKQEAVSENTEDAKILYGLEQ